LAIGLEAGYASSTLSSIDALSPRVSCEAPAMIPCLLVWAALSPTDCVSDALPRRNTPQVSSEALDFLQVLAKGLQKNATTAAMAALPDRSLP
jgi:hypothetical protein